MRPTTITLNAGDQELTVYHATTPRDWRQGLLGRNLVDMDGMLFTFTADVRNAFHMRNMPIPLLLAFFDTKGALLDLTFLRVGAEPYTPPMPYRHALELIGRHTSAKGATKILPYLDVIAPP